MLAEIELRKEYFFSCSPIQTRSARTIGYDGNRSSILLMIPMSSALKTLLVWNSPTIDVGIMTWQKYFFPMDFIIARSNYYRFSC